MTRAVVDDSKERVAKKGRHAPGFCSAYQQQYELDTSEEDDSDDEWIPSQVIESIGTEAAKAAAQVDGRVAGRRRRHQPADCSRAESGRSEIGEIEETPKSLWLHFICLWPKVVSDNHEGSYEKWCQLEAAANAALIGICSAYSQRSAFGETRRIRSDGHV